MLRYHPPTEQQKEDVCKILNAKLQDFPQLCRLLSMNGKADINQAIACLSGNESTPMWFFILMHFPQKQYPVQNSKHIVVNDLKRYQIMLLYNIPSHTDFVKAWWKYILDLTIATAPSLSVYNEQVSTRFSFSNPYTFGYNQIYSSFWFGIRLKECCLATLEIIHENKPYALKLRATMFNLGLPQFGRVCFGEGRELSLYSCLEQLKRCNHKISIKIDDPNTISPWDETSELTQLIAKQVMMKSKLGFITDGQISIISTITGIKDREMKVELDVSIESATFVQYPPMYPPHILVIAKIAQIHSMNPANYRRETDVVFDHAKDWAQKAYLDSFFKEACIKRIFEKLSQERYINPHHTQIYYDLQTSEEIQREMGSCCQAFYLPKQFINVPMVDMSILDGEDVTVQVYDPLRLHVCYRDAAIPFTDHLFQLRQIFERQMRYDMRSWMYNVSHGCRINTRLCISIGFCSFWRDASKARDSSNYIASGSTVVMKKLTEKPKTRDDFLKGLKQLIIMNDGSLQDFHIKYDDMFMDDGEFVFFSFGWFSSDYDCTVHDSSLSSKIKDFTEIWREIDIDVTDAFVMERVRQFQAEVQRDNDSHNRDKVLLRQSGNSPFFVSN